MLKNDHTYKDINGYTVKAIFKNDKLIKKITYFDNGDIKAIGNYKADKLHGEYKTYHRNGNIETIGNYNSGLLNGDVRSYYDSGKIKSMSTYKNGKLCGEYQSYDENGNKKKIQHLLLD